MLPLASNLTKSARAGCCHQWLWHCAVGTGSMGDGRNRIGYETKINACFLAQPEFCKLPPPPWRRSAASVAGSAVGLSRAVRAGAAGSGGAGVRALGRVLRGGAASFATGVLSGAARGRDLRAPPPLACGRYGVGNLQHRAASPPLLP